MAPGGRGHRAGRARETYLHAWVASHLAGPLARPGGLLLEVSKSAQAAPQPSGVPRPSDLLLDGLTTMIVERRVAAEPAIRRAVNTFLGDQVSDEDRLQWGILAQMAAMAVWDFDNWLVLSTRDVEFARAPGALTPLSVALNARGSVAVLCGDIETATSLAVLRNGLGRHAEALAAAQSATEETCRSVSTQLVLPELIEAAVRTGRADLAREALDRLSAMMTMEGSDWAKGLQARSRALVSEGQEAEQCYAEAVERLGRTPLRPELARAHLLYGEWLRRENRRNYARHQLHAAYRLFTAIGAEAFAERARSELLATGERSADARSVPITSSLRRRSTSSGWPGTDAPTPRSPQSYSSVPAPWNGTSARCSPNLALLPAESSKRCRPGTSGRGTRAVRGTAGGVDPWPPPGRTSNRHR